MRQWWRVRVPERQGRRDAERGRGAIGVRSESRRGKVGRAVVVRRESSVRLAVGEGRGEGVDGGEMVGQRPGMLLGRTGGEGLVEKGTVRVRRGGVQRRTRWWHDRGDGCPGRRGEWPGGVAAGAH